MEIIMIQGYGLVPTPEQCRPILIIGKGQYSAEELAAIEVAKGEFGEALTIISEDPNPDDEDVHPRLLVLTSMYRGIEGIQEHLGIRRARREMLAAH